MTDTKQPITKIELEDGDIPAIGIQHTSPTETRLIIYDYKGEILVQGKLSIEKAYELSSTLVTQPPHILSDDD